MSGEGKYTIYAPPSNAKNLLLNKLFRSSDAVNQAPTQDLVGKEIEAREAVLAIARAKLQPQHQEGDLGLFPTGVDLDYGTAPKVEDVQWTNAGDPANPYMPDITSPGPGKTAGTDKNVDPELATTDIKENFVQGSPDGGTRSPASTNSKIFTANRLGTPGVLGNSGGNS